MIKLSKEQQKFAHQVGVARALGDNGYSPEAIKLAFVQSGVSPEVSDELVKIAIWGLLGRGAAMAARGIARYGGKAGAGLMRAGASKGGTIGNLLTKGGKGMRGATAGLTKGVSAFGKRPIHALGGGAQNFGKGLLFGGGKGVGGVIGKGAFGAGTASMIFGGNKPKMPQGPYGGMQYN